MEKPIRLGISTCLLGERVRYDGGHKLDPFLTRTFGEYVEYVPVCPEFECGLPVPREPMHLEGDPDFPRLVTSRTKQDMTERMIRWAKQRVMDLEKEKLMGFIFKSNSPSSGMGRIRIYNEKGVAVKKGVGIFARIFMDHFPLFPVEDEGRLHDPALRENFIERLFALKRWRDAVTQGRSRGALVDFHTQHQLLILSHSPNHYRILGKLVAQPGLRPLERLYDDYQQLLLQSLQLKSTSKKNTNVLLHMLGYFKRELSPDEKQELLEIIDLYRGEVLPLIVPITLIKHYVRKYDQPYLKQQLYLNPHPIELQLRNHV